jgi:pentatricopeptide repeat protein
MQKHVKPDVSTLTILMSVHVEEPEIEAAMFYWTEMKKLGMQPDIKYRSYQFNAFVANS